MVEIEYKGGNSVVISTKKASIVADPKASLVGLKDVSVKGSVELLTEARFGMSSGAGVGVDGATLVIEGPGEYGVADFDIKGIAAQRHLDAETEPKIGTMYRIEVDGVRIALFGNIYEKLTDDQLEEIGVVDVVIIPVGGSGYTLDPTAAATLVRSIDPKVVIPVHYAEAGLKYEVPQLELDEFTKNLGVDVEETSKYKLKTAGALPASLTVVKVTRS
ncbi:MBL fold metallo-hydrolase [Candidatus Saccharibacteria bacterium TM7i]|nr:MBL fold metallo-hydrolase [Candidatus Saccharibacteria bacterium TM7i]